MKISEIKELLDAKVICGEDKLDTEVTSAFASDFMSDILAFADGQQLLFTGMLNQQVIRTAEMVDMKCIVFVRSKVPDEDIINLASTDGLILLSTTKLLYDACGLLYVKGLKSEE